MSIKDRDSELHCSFTQAVNKSLQNKKNERRVECPYCKDKFVETKACKCKCPHPSELPICEECTMAMIRSTKPGREYNTGPSGQRVLSGPEVTKMEARELNFIIDSENKNNG